MRPITYLTGDATKPTETGGTQFILHVCNDAGAWGMGFVLALSKKNRGPEFAYRSWYKTNEPKFALGEIQITPYEGDTFVVNMVAQHGFGTAHGNVPLRYDALRSCLRAVQLKAKAERATLHAPRFGSGLAGGSWDEIEKIINEEICAHDLSITIYDLPTPADKS